MEQKPESSIIFLGLEFSHPLGCRKFLGTLAIEAEGEGPGNLAALLRGVKLPDGRPALFPSVSVPHSLVRFPSPLFSVFFLC